MIDSFELVLISFFLIILACSVIVFGVCAFLIITVRIGL